MNEAAKAEFKDLFTASDIITVDPQTLERKFTIPERNRAMVRQFRDTHEKVFMGKDGIRRLPASGKTIIITVTKRYAETLATMLDEDGRTVCTPDHEIRAAEVGLRFESWFGACVFDAEQARWAGLIGSRLKADAMNMAPCGDCDFDEHPFKVLGRLIFGVNEAVFPRTGASAIACSAAATRTRPRTLSDWLRGCATKCFRSMLASPMPRNGFHGRGGPVSLPPSLPDAYNSLIEPFTKPANGRVRGDQAQNHVLIHFCPLGTACAGQRETKKICFILAMYAAMAQMPIEHRHGRQGSGRNSRIEARARAYSSRCQKQA